MVQTPGNLPILDEQHLKRQTMDNPELETEILALFVTEAERLLRQIEESEDVRTRFERIHAIRGLARNIGAQKLAMIALNAEKADALDLKEIRAAVDEVITHIKTAEGRVEPH